MEKSKILWFVCGVFLIYSLGLSQAAGTRGSVSGVVKSTEGTTLAQAKVRISGPQLPAGREYITSENGVFRFASLIPGKYKLEITHPEMVDLSLEVIVSLDKETQVEAVMVPVGRVEEEVVVTAAAPLVDTKSTEISTNIDSATIRSLPLGRTYGSLLQLAPGVAGGRLNAGGNQQDNVFLYDGSNVTNPFFANLFSSFSELDVQEINIKRGAVSAEFGRAVGMVTNAITKSGSNSLSGSARFVYEPAAWYAKFKDPTIITKTDVLRPSLGFGGPLLKDRLWWYFSANLPYSKTTGRVNKWGPVPDSKYPTNEFFLKVNANFHPKHQLVASIRNSSTEGKNAGIGIYDNPSTATNSKSNERIYYFSWTWVISPNSYLELKYDHVDQKNRNVPVTELGYKPAFDPTRLDKMGYFRTVSGYMFGAPEVGLYVGAASMFNTQNFFRDELKLVFTQYLDFRGHSHVIKAGFGYDYGGEYLDRVANGWGTVAYVANIAPYVGGSARSGFSARYYPEGSIQKSAGRTFALFAQDTVTILDRLTLSLGVLLNRDEYLTFGKNEFNFLVNKDAYIANAATGYETRKFLFDFTDEIQPRVGFTLVLDKKAGDKLYGNFGRYYALDNKSIARAAAPKRIYYVDAYFELSGGQPIKEIPSAAETRKVVDPKIKPTYQDETVFGYSRPLFRKKWVVDLWYQFRTVKNVIEDYPLVNYGKWAAPSRFIYSHVPWAHRRYRAFNLQVQRPFAGRWSLLLMYTWSKLWGNWDLDYATSLFYASSALDDCPGLYMTDPNREGILLGDRTHILKVFASWEFWQRAFVGAYFRYQSGAPWQMQGRSWWYSYRTYLEPAGSRRVDPWANLDLQLSYTLPIGRLNAVIEARLMNVLNNQAVLYVDTTKYFNVVTWDPYTPRDENPNFGKAVSYASPRRFALTFYINF